MAFVKNLVMVATVAALAREHGHLHAQNPGAATSETAVLHFAFRDSIRGTVIKPDAILVDEKVVFNTIDEAGRVSVPVTPGDHRVVIKAEGYNDLDSKQTANLDHAPMNLLVLDPTAQPDQLKPENLSAGMPADGTFIAGFVTDERMGSPVEGAVVTLVNKDVTVKSDETGFFKLPVSLPDGKQMPEDPRGVLYSTRDFRIEKPGYGYEERLNVLLETGTPKVYQVELVRGGGGNSLDEASGRNNLQSSLFGLRNVEPEDQATTPTRPEDRASSTTHDHDHDHPHSN